MAVFYIKQGDTSPAFRAILKDADGTAVDITGNLGVTFHMRNQAGTVVVDAAATVNDASAGDVKYSWSAGDTDTAGVYDAEFEVTYANGDVETFPNYGYEKVRITDDLA